MFKKITLLLSLVVAFSLNASAQLSYSADFTAGAASDWTAIDNNASGTTWAANADMSGETGMCVLESSFDDYYVSPAFALVADVTYTIKARAANPYGVCGGTITLENGTSATDATTFATVGTVNAASVYSWSEATADEFTFTPAADGTYYFAFHLTGTSGNAYSNYLLDFSIEGAQGSLATGGGEEETPETPELEEGEFVIVENFDDDSHFTASTSVPDGWLCNGDYPFSRNTGSYFGATAKSGSYVFGTPASYSYGRGETIFTPLLKLAAGKECTITFSVWAPGGGSSARTNKIIVRAASSQSSDATTTPCGEVPAALYSSWSEFSFTFTPETDGEYCFHLVLVASIGNSGNVAIDDVTIKGTGYGVESTPGTGEEEATAATLPYSIDFTAGAASDWTAIDNNASGTTWTASSDLTGELGLSVSESSYDDYYVSPAFTLEADVTYNIKIRAANPWGVCGGSIALEQGTSATDVTTFESVGTLNPATVNSWAEATTSDEFTFTPTEAGTYYFAFHITGTHNMPYSCYVLDFSIEEKEAEVVPVALPYAIDFTAKENTEWTTIDNAGDLTWNYETDGYNMSYPAVSIAPGYGVEVTADDYYVSPAFTLEAGKEYKVSTRVADGFNLSGGTFNLMIGTSAKDASSFKLVSALSPAYSWDYDDGRATTNLPVKEYTVTVEETGVYYFAYYMAITCNVGYLYSLVDFAVTEPLYVTGDNIGGNWDAVNPDSFTLDAMKNAYVYTVDENTAAFKISTAKGDWDTFNASNLAADAAITKNGTVNLSVNSSADNITLPWKADWTISVASDLKTLTAQTDSYQPLYIFGSFQGWTPASSTQMACSNGVYSVEGLEFAAGGNFALSTVQSDDWDAVNAARYGFATDNALATDGVAMPIVKGEGAIQVPSEGVYTISVSLEDMTVTVSRTGDLPVEYPAALYVLGNLSSGSWLPNAGVELAMGEDGVYSGSFELVQQTDGYAYFSFATALSASSDDWSAVNASVRYGATESNATLEKNVPATIVADNSGNPNAWRIAVAESATVSVTVSLVDMTVVIDQVASGIEGVEAEVANAEAVYYNLQGIKVANPAAGEVYIVRRGNTVTKEVKF
ncbi:MAG: hypothetical protein IJY31_05855 [Muribaculaceae bacterium]|nr:hypothetical protein [Muribaculaceae bacterium]